MYEKQTPKQQNGLMYGFKLRVIGSIQGNLGYCNQVKVDGNVDTFTPEEMQQIERICNDAKARAKETFEETRRRLDTDLGASTESRTYNGK